MNSPTLLKCRISRTALLLGFVMGLVFSLGISDAKAASSDPQIKNLLGRFSRSQVRGGGKLLLSYENSNSSFLYDQALAVLAFVKAGEKGAAEQVLNALAHLQFANGSWAFQYQSVSGQMIPAQDTVSPSGAVAWVAMAVEAYEKKYDAGHSMRYKEMLLKTLSYLDSRRVRVKWGGKVSQPVSFSPTRNTIVSFEHNLDAYSAFSNAPEDLPTSKENATIASSIRSFLESMWNSNRFYAGFDTAEGKPNREEDYLDTQSWGILALGVSGSQGENFRQGLKTNCTEFQASATGTAGNRANGPLSGFAFYHPARTRAPASTAPIWTEGSLGMMFAMKMAQVQECDDKTLADYERSMDLLTQSDGGVPYATESSDPDFSSKSSIAGTAWKYFFKIGFNPFHPSFD